MVERKGRRPRPKVSDITELDQASLASIEESVISRQDPLERLLEHADQPELPGVSAPEPPLGGDQRPLTARRDPKTKKR